MTRARNTLFLFSSDGSNPSRYLVEIDASLLEIISPNQSAPISNNDLPF